MYTSINRNARPNNKQLITYYKHVITYKEYIQYPVESTYNNNFCCCRWSLQTVVASRWTVHLVKWKWWKLWQLPLVTSTDQWRHYCPCHLLALTGNYGHPQPSFQSLVALVHMWVLLNHFDVALFSEICHNEQTNFKIYKNIVSCLSVVQLGGSSTGLSLVGPTKVQKSFLFTEGSPKVENKKNMLLCLYILSWNCIAGTARHRMAVPPQF